MSSGLVQCRQCSTQFEKHKRGASAFCSSVCHRAFWRALTDQRAREKRVSEMRSRTCLTCGAMFVRLRRGQFCSKACSLLRRCECGGLRPKMALACRACRSVCVGCRVAISPAPTRRYCATCKRDAQRDAAHRHRIARRGGDLTTDGAGLVVIRAELYREARGRCGICREIVPLLVDVMDPYAPTIDHIIPLARGGRHTRDNVQLAHRRCNCAKSDRVEASA